MAKTWQPQGIVEMNDEQSNRIAEAVAEADWDEMTLSDFEDMFEDRDPFEFL